jgi:hypothetical protein
LDNNDPIQEILSKNIYLISLNVFVKTNRYKLGKILKTNSYKKKIFTLKYTHKESISSKISLLKSTKIKTPEASLGSLEPNFILSISNSYWNYKNGEAEEIKSSLSNIFKELEEKNIPYSIFDSSLKEHIYKFGN